MKTFTFGTHGGKALRKIRYAPEDIPLTQPFTSPDVSFGSPLSNIALGCIPSHLEGVTPEDREQLQRLSDRCAVAGFWSTTNGAKYVFANILANPNINKLVLYCGKRDNTHLLMDACIQFWKEGVDEHGIIRGAKAMNPKFEGLSILELERLRGQADLVVLRNVKDISDVGKTLEACYQEPENAVPAGALDVSCTVAVYPDRPLCDEGIRVEAPYHVDKDYVFERDIYHFDAFPSFIEHFPKIVFYQGTMAERAPPWFTESPAGGKALYATLALSAIKINGTGDPAAEALEQARSVPDVVFADHDGTFSTVVLRRCFCGVVDGSGRTLRPSGQLQALARLPGRLLLIIKDAVTVIDHDGR